MAQCDAIYQGNSYPHLRGERCILSKGHDPSIKHAGSREHGDLRWVSKTPEQIKKEAEDDWYRAPECCLYPGLKDLDTQHYYALLENEARDRDWMRGSHVPDAKEVKERYKEMGGLRLVPITPTVCGKPLGEPYNHPCWFAPNHNGDCGSHYEPGE